MTSEHWYYLGLVGGFIIGLLVGAGFWRTHAIMWRNDVGYMGRRNHK